MTTPLPSTAHRVTRQQWLSWTIVAIVLVLILELHLLPALLGGLVVYELVALLERVLRFTTLETGRLRAIAVTLLAAIVIALLVMLGIGGVAFFRHSTTAIPHLIDKLADALADAQLVLPDWIGNYIPTSPDEVRKVMQRVASQHGAMLSSAGREFGRVAAHILIGMVLGGLLALHHSVSVRRAGPLSVAIGRSSLHFAAAFRRVVLAQGWIALVNTVFTAIYLLVGLRVFGVHLPLVKTLIAFTFIVGLLPIVGNLISNAAILAVSFTYSPAVTIASLVFLVAIHKLEYFLNAKIVGTHIRARAWEMLLAMLVMEAAFGIAGLVAAPIYYAYFKREFVRTGLI